MSQRKNVDYVSDSIYGAHLRGDTQKFANAPGANRMALHQRMYVKKFTELAANRFEWHGLPETIDPRFLEMTLFSRALAVFFKDPKNDGYFVARAGSSGQWDLQDNPTEFTLFGPQFQSRRLKSVRSFLPIVRGGEDTLEAVDPECVPIWANYLRVPDVDVVMLYAMKLADLDITIEINSHNARYNKIVSVDENSRLTAVNANRMLDQGDNFIQLTDGIAGILPTTLDLGVPVEVHENLHILKVRLKNEFMEMMGINGANQDKKERLVAAEVGANDEQIDINKDVALNARQEACELINNLYPELNVSVELRSEQRSASVGSDDGGKPGNQGEKEVE